MRMRREWALQFDDPELAAENEPAPRRDFDRLFEVRKVNGWPCHVVSRTVTYSDWAPHPWGESSTTPESVCPTCKGSRWQVLDDGPGDREVWPCPACEGRYG